MIYNICHHLSYGVRLAFGIKWISFVRDILVEVNSAESCFTLCVIASRLSELLKKLSAQVKSCALRMNSFGEPLLPLELDTF